MARVSSINLPNKSKNSSTKKKAFLYHYSQSRLWATLVFVGQHSLSHEHLECRIELDRSLKMLFSKLVHPEVLQSEADHPMVKRIVGGELVGLLFMPVALWDRCRLPGS